MYAGIAWMKASLRVWIPGLGGISTRPSPFSSNMLSSAAMISAMDKPTASTSFLLKYRTVSEFILVPPYCIADRILCVDYQDKIIEVSEPLGLARGLHRTVRKRM